MYFPVNKWVCLNYIFKYGSDPRATPCTHNAAKSQCPIPHPTPSPPPSHPTTPNTEILLEDSNSIGQYNTTESCGTGLKILARILEKIFCNLPLHSSSSQPIVITMIQVQDGP